MLLLKLKVIVWTNVFVGEPWNRKDHPDYAPNARSVASASQSVNRYYWSHECSLCHKL